ncbi:MAG: nucleotidyl transferase AbiEii/AbiGii toxin family protein, partial [Ignavibacteriales bacterium]|nr:nucleotidyl transferase AbiEii/AbiGii toxin family protein [Ignavibacteriales bacterium]
MLSLTEIEKFYPDNQRAFKRNLLREYLQYKILQIIFNTEYSSQLSFMGGTCLRIIFGTSRFSEDLDFDNFGLTGDEFDAIADGVSKELKAEGYSVEIKTVHKGAFRCYIRIPGLLFDNKLSGFYEEKILIQLDTESQKYDYRAEPFILNKFDIVTRIFYTPGDILLSQKLWAILNRKTQKGRDYYDTMFLFSIAKPDFKYLEMKAGISNIVELKAKLLAKLNETEIGLLVKDVSPFLINPNDVKRIELFK